jgi:hypothetical protein
LNIPVAGDAQCRDRNFGSRLYLLAPPVKPENLQLALAGFAAINLVGFNVTIPHKQAILPLLSEISPIALPSEQLTQFGVPRMVGLEQTLMSKDFSLPTNK